jgi:glycosyltransferase involved in cell wall biosynthesis
MNQRKPRPELNWVGNCPNALEFDLYPFAPERGDYLLFLGRMSHDKGAHRAVRTAIETGMPLKIAGKMREPLEKQYFDEYVRPHLSSRIEYVGEVSHGEKVELLQHACATLFPINWEEPFGLVMIESMACGTPVIAMRRGAVEEVIGDGGGGVIIDDWRDASKALEAADAIEPETCRAYVEEWFAPERMVRDYLAAYESMLA